MFLSSFDNTRVGVLQVYLDGVFYAAVLDDVVMQPLTGKLMGVLYRYYTPGGHCLAAFGKGQVAGNQQPQAPRLSAACPGVASSGVGCLG